MTDGPSGQPGDDHGLGGDDSGAGAPKQPFVPSTTYPRPVTAPQAPSPAPGQARTEPPPAAPSVPPAPASAEPPPQATPSPARSPYSPPPPTAASRRGRRATLVLTRVDPWSTLKASFLYSCALVVVLVVAVIALYALLSGMGVFDSVDNVLSKTAPGVHIGYPLSRVVLVSLVVGLVDVILLTALCTLGAFLYNLVADVAGGVEVTLAERD